MEIVSTIKVIRMLRIHGTADEMMVTIKIKIKMRIIVDAK